MWWTWQPMAQKKLQIFNSNLHQPSTERLKHHQGTSSEPFLNTFKHSQPSPFVPTTIEYFWLLLSPCERSEYESLLKSGTNIFHPPVYWAPLSVCHSEALLLLLLLLYWSTDQYNNVYKVKGVTSCPQEKRKKEWSETSLTPSLCLCLFIGITRLQLIRPIERTVYLSLIWHKDAIFIFYPSRIPFKWYCLDSAITVPLGEGCNSYHGFFICFLFFCGTFHNMFQTRHTLYLWLSWVVKNC